MLLDNRAQGRVADVLAERIAKGARLSMLSSGFSIYAYSLLKDHIKRIDSLRLLLPAGAPSGAAAGDAGFCVEELAGGEVTDRRFRNQLDMARIARDCAKWLRDTAEVRAVRSPTPQNLIHVVNRGADGLAISGSSPFTSSGLGFVASPRFDMNTLFTTKDEVGSLLAWFDGIWNVPDLVRDVKPAMLAQLEAIYRDKSPELIYFLTLYHVFSELREDLDEERIIKTRTGIKDTLVWNKLYRFQRDGVLGAIDKIEKHNGCIIADSVGLGKTFEALAIIKYYELRNDRVLVLCPKKLRENWTIYTVNDRRNLFAADRFNYDVLNHTDLTREQGKSGEITLESLNWGNYDLIVIDESHNFRNNPPRKDGLTRYGRLMRDVIQSGVKTKVLMLSATPVNNRMNDLKNQVAFITEGRDDAFHGQGIASIEQSLRVAQIRFNQWLRRDADERTTDGLLEALNFDYFKLLDLLTIARSRRHIEKYYDLDEIGRFPERAKPINVKAEIDTRDEFPELKEINRDIRRLNLSAYAPLKYVLPAKLLEYSRKYDRQVAGGSVFKQIDREESLIHLLRVNLLKRMESSINSFALTVERLLGQVQTLIGRIDAHEDAEVEELGIEDIEIEDDAFDPYLVGTKIKVLLQDVDRVRWRQELEEDQTLLVKLLREAREIDAGRDAKLGRLKALIADKSAMPINPGNRKIVVFTAFADTATYLYRHIADWALEGLGLHCAVVSGVTGSNRTNLPKVRRDIASILTAFAPIAKERAMIDAAETAEIDILIATDCISEGQNLQDCDYLVNYDIHWNPVRIIQRFGRIDRLGSRNETTDAGQMKDLEYRRRQLEQLQNEVVDAEDLGGGISITDMTLNDFRMDLAEYLKGYAQGLEAMPPGAFAVARLDQLFGNLLEEGDLAPGVIFCLRSDNARVRADSTYALAPHYLVYVSDDGETRLNFTNARKILDLFKKLTLGRSHPDPHAVAAFNAATRDGADMSHYQGLLGKAVAAITGKAEERGVESLFQRGGTVLTNDSFRGMDDFEVIAYLVILGKPREAA